MKRLLCIVLLFCPWVMADSSLSPQARERLQAGLQAEKQQQFEAATAEFRKVTELEPGAAAGFAMLGHALMARGLYGEAIPPLKRAVELDPELLAAHRLLGYALLAQGYAGEAIAHLQKVQDKGALGIAQLEIQQPGPAVVNLQAAVTEQPNDPDLLFYLSRAAQLLSSQSGDKLVDAFPGSARAHQMLGQNYFAARQFAEAERQYEVALELRPDLPGLHLELGQVYAESSQWAKAADEFRTETKKQPGNAQAAYLLGNALLQQGMAAEALVELKRANQLKPDMTETLYALGKAASTAGEDGIAEHSWKRVAELEPSGSLASQAHFSLAALYRKQKKLELAAQELQAFRKLRGDETANGPASSGH